MFSCFSVGYRPAERRFTGRTIFLGVIELIFAFTVIFGICAVHQSVGDPEFHFST